MFLCIVLESKIQRVIDVNWLENIVLRDQMRAGDRPKQSEKHTIFYCNDTNRPPNFDLPLSLEFDAREERCYQAYILNYFGKLSFSLKL